MNPDEHLFCPVWDKTRQVFMHFYPSVFPMGNSKLYLDVNFLFIEPPAQRPAQQCKCSCSSQCSKRPGENGLKNTFADPLKNIHSLTCRNETKNNVKKF